MLTGDEVRSMFDYKEGKLYWKLICNQVKVGQEAGSLDDDYYRVGIKGKLYYLHNIIWLYHHSYSPEQMIDHIDKNKLNNKIENLREISRSCNALNTDNYKSNTSGVKGVCWKSSRGVWSSGIRRNNKTRFLGERRDFNEAVLLRLTAEICLGCDYNSPAYRYYKERMNG